MMRDCQVVRSREGSSEVISGRARLSSRQYHEVARKLSRPPPCAAPGPPQIAAVACASVPASMCAAPQAYRLCTISTRSASYAETALSSFWGLHTV